MKIPVVDRAEAVRALQQGLLDHPYRVLGLACGVGALLGSPLGKGLLRLAIGPAARALVVAVAAQYLGNSGEGEHS
jgi:hypothetical protein